MFFYFGLVLFLIVFSFSRFKYKDYFVFVILLFFMACRGENVGVDLENYLPTYSWARSMSWEEYFYNVNMERGFLLLNKFMSFFWSTSRGYIVLTSILMMWLLKRYVEQYSEDKIFSYILYIMLGYYGMSFNIIRQMLAVLVLLQSLEYIRNRNFKKFICIYLIAVMVHYTAVVFIILYFIYPIKINKLYIGICLFISICNLLFASKLLTMLIKVFPRYENRYSAIMTSEEGYKLLIVYFLLVLSILFFKVQTQYKYKIFCHMILITLVLQSLSTGFALFVRVVVYFSISLIIIIPSLFFRDKNQKILEKIIFYTLILVFYCYVLKVDKDGVVPYIFLN